jgi:hypothetical protein
MNVNRPILKNKHKKLWMNNDCIQFKFSFFQEQSSFDIMFEIDNESMREEKWIKNRFPTSLYQSLESHKLFQILLFTPKLWFIIKWTSHIQMLLSQKMHKCMHT